MSATQPYGLPQSILQAFLNKSPKEGPRYVPMAFNFSSTTSWGVDLTPYVQGGQLSAVQSFFIDNSQNDEPVEISMGIGGGQTIQLDAGQQGWVSCLLNNNPQFTVSSTGTSAIVFACNFQMFNAVWYANKNAAGADQSVNLAEVGGTAFTLGQALMAASIPVVIASDQSVIPTIDEADTVNTTQVTLSSAAAVNFASDVAKRLTLVQVDLSGYELAAANTLTIKDGGGNTLAVRTILPAAAATLQYLVINMPELAVAMANASAPPSAVLGTAPTAGSVLVTLGWQ